MTSQNALRVLAGLVITLLVAACSMAPAAPTTTTNYDRQYDFSRVHKIYIEPLSRTDAATIVVTDAQAKRIDGALANELARKGFETVNTSRQADLFLSWYLVTEDPVEASSADCNGCDTAADGGTRYAKGTLIVDMVDPMRNQAVWRSVLKTGLTGQPDSAKAEQARLDAAAAIFSGFPPQ